MQALAARALIGLLWLLHWLPLRWQALLGRALGAVLLRTASRRRHIAETNLALCFPEQTPAWRAAVLRQHFGWLGRSLLERGVLWFASPARLRRLIHVDGDVDLAARSERPVMWLVPHFLALDVAGAATQLFQAQWVASIYQAQSNPVFDAAVRRGRLRFGGGEVFDRHAKGARPLVRAIVQKRAAFFNLPDMDFGRAETVFAPFFGTPASTLLAPSKMARSLKMVVQPVVAEMLPGGQGWRVRFGPAWTDWPTDDPAADAATLNAWIATEIRRQPAQYLWVHRRFKTRPEGEAGVY